MKKALILGVIAGVLSAGFGCSAFQSGGGEGEMMVSDSLVMADMPVPSGYKIENDRSFFNVNFFNL